ncbi:MAG: DUF5302 domain-containing protein [Nocardioidaceae bacterium]|nr:DUF5302 domain-containing protein [Nocardioidaceae bacterium]
MMASQSKPGHDDEQHRKFREALDRKKAQRNDMHAEGATNEGIGEVHNDKQPSQFRRKSIGPSGQ